MVIDDQRYLIAFDPGKLTGVAWFYRGTFDSTQLTTEELYEFVDEACEGISHAQVEQFIINAGTLQKAREYDALYNIGYLRYCAWRCGFQIEFTKPADVMKPFPDAALKRAGMFNTGHGHANDAARHLAHHLTRNRLIDAKIFLPK